MYRYTKVKVIGKGSFGCAVLAIDNVSQAKVGVRGGRAGCRLCVPNSVSLKRAAARGSFAALRGLGRRLS